MNCSNEAFLWVVHSFMKSNEDSMEMMSFEDCTDEELLEDRVEVIRSIVSYAEMLYA